MASFYMKNITFHPVLSYLGVLITLLLFILPILSSSTNPSEEANALLKWKESLQSHNQSILPSWSLPIGRGQVNSSSHCSNWAGISCNKAGRVTDISLSNIGLIGSLVGFPTSSFSNLFTLDLSSNALFGTVPADIANLTQLSYMDLSNNQFVGEVPPEISQLASLQTLYLNGNSFKGSIPSGLFNLTNLVSLDLYHNQFSGPLPSDITKLKSLEGLDVSENNLKGPIPSFLGNMTKLTALYIYTNQFSGPIPIEIGNLRSIVTLDLSANNLNGSMPYTLFSLRNLTNLLLSKSGLSGSIPEEIGNLSSLARLELFNNSFTGSIPSSVGKLTKLVTFHVHNNNLSGSVPRELANSKYLKLLELRNNHFSGVIPQEFSKLKNLTFVALGDNNFFGALPNFCSGGVLQYFTAMNNRFSGLIQNSLKNCPSLIRVRLERNQLNGNMSDVFGVYPRLEYVDFSFNKLYGEISHNWWGCRNLTNFKFSANNITGRIPRGFGGLTQLGLLDISSNHLRGEIPSDLGKLSSLVHLNLSLNQLSGHLPSKMGRFKSLETLDISANDLSGSLPKEIGDCSQLLYLDLSKNNFGGGIPSQIGNLIYLQMLLDLSQNMFTQEIPSELGKLRSLEKLNLSHNILSGSIPSSFGNMGSLTFVDVSFNALEGLVPDNKAFRDASAQNFRNNTGLCGNNTALGPCILPQISNGSGGRPRWILQILMPSLIGLFLLGLAFLVSCFAFHKERMGSMEGRRKTGKGHIFGIWHYDGKITYEDIIKATEGFSEKYCIGVGGSGSVYKVELSTGRPVAVKKFHQLIENEADNLKSFDTEVRALLELKHRNIVKLYGFCLHVLHSFLIYEYLERGSLAKILSNMEEAASLDWTKRINIIKSIAKALCHMHHGCTSPIIHRDISSKNILLNSEYDAYVADFGIARVLKHNSSEWTAVAGTYGYLAPEFAYTTKLTEKCDVYSFGVLTLEVLMGSHPADFVSGLVGTTSTPSRTQMLMMLMLDKRLPPPASDIYHVLLTISELAFACLNSSPESRPTFEFISNELSAYKAIIKGPLDTTKLDNCQENDIERGSYDMTPISS